MDDGELYAQGRFNDHEREVAKARAEGFAAGRLAGMREVAAHFDSIDGHDGEWAERAADEIRELLAQPAPAAVSEKK